MPLSAKDIPTLGGFVRAGGIEHGLGLLKERAFERVCLIPAQGHRGSDGLPEIAEFVKQTALMGEVGIHQPERRDQAGAAIMDEQFDAPLSVYSA